MMEETVTVVKAEDGYVTIEALKQSACGGCSQKNGCGVASVAGLFSGRAVRLVVENSLGARAGDTVVVGMDDSVFLRLVVRAYLVPLLVLIVSAMAFSRLFDSEWPVVMFSLAVMSGSFFVGRGRTSSALQLLRVVESAGSNIHPEVRGLKV